MQQRNWESVALLLDPNARPETPDVDKDAPLRPGPIISAIVEDDPYTDKGLAGLLHGQVFLAEDGRIIVRYTEVELPGGERVPVCFTVRRQDSVFDVQNGEVRDGIGWGPNLQYAKRVRVFPD